ncbi:MAG: histidine kinase dimerization/phospho-acceptor domain-containing protein, partial [Pseudomonadota bacterium]
MSGAKPGAGTHEAELGLILDTIPQAVIVADAKHNIRYANAGAESMFGASSTHLARNRLDRFVPFGSPVLSLVERAINKQEPVNEYQIDISSPRNRQGTVVDVHAAPMEALGELVLLTFRERGMPDRIDRQLTHRGAARSVTGLASMLAHEIKNPLSGIRGAAQLLESVVGDGDRELAQLITSETDRIVKILDRMEVFSDETPIEREPVNMHLVLGRIRQIAENGFGKN